MYYYLEQEISRRNVTIIFTFISHCKVILWSYHKVNFSLPHITDQKGWNTLIDM